MNLKPGEVRLHKQFITTEQCKPDISRSNRDSLIQIFSQRQTDAQRNVRLWISWIKTNSLTEMMLALELLKEEELMQLQQRT